MNKEDQSRFLRKAFSDISRGYSVVFHRGKKLVIKHLSHHEQVNLDILYKKFLKEGEQEGLPTEKYMLDFLNKEGVWTEADDNEMKESQTIIERLVDGKKIIYKKSDLENQNKEIKKYQDAYSQKRAQKSKFIGLTAEAWAEKKVNEYYIVESFYLDEKCSRKWLEDSVLDEVGEAEMQEVIRLYNEEMEVVSDRSIKLLAIQDFFQMYWGLSSENLYDFFGKPICDLTYFQVKTGTYGRTFRSILEKAETYPEDVRNDPDKLLDYIRVSENAKERMENASKDSSSNDGGTGNVASTIFGAKKEEMNEMGIQSDPGTVSLSDCLKKAQAEGKKGLSMQDMIAIMGV